MQQIGLKCTNENLIFTNIPKIYSGDKDTIGLSVEFNSLWDTYGRTAVFYYYTGEAFFRVLDVNNECIVPREVLNKEGKVYIGIIGSDGSKVITSELVVLKVGRGATTLSGIEDPSPEVWEQILGQYGNTIDIVNKSMLEQRKAINAEKAERMAEIDIERKRINELSKLPSGSTTGDAELIDIRTGSDGTVYTNAGEAVRNQVNFLGDRVDEKTDAVEELGERGIIKFYYNFVQGAILQAGSETTAKTYIKTDFIRFDNDEILRLEPLNGYNVAIATYSSNSIESFENRGNFNNTSFIFKFSKNKYYKIVVGYDESTQIVPKMIDKLNIFKMGEVSKQLSYYSKHIEIGHKLYQALLPNTVINTATGNPEVNTGYYATPFIDVKDIDIVYVGAYRNITRYDEDYNYISANANETTNIINEIQVPNNIRYIRFSVRKEKQEVFTVSDIPYVDPVETWYGIKIENLPNENKLIGKTLYGFGDSLVYGHHSGFGFLDGLASQNGMSYTKYAVNGAKVCNTIINQISGASDTVPDFVVFDGLTNDAYDETISNTLGEMISSYSGGYDISTFCGAFENICYTLREKYPTSNIIYVAPHNMPTRSANSQKVLHEKAKEICKKWAIPVVDIYNSGQINTNIDAMRIAWSYNNQGETTNGNGTHLTGEGYDKWYAPLIVNQMVKMIE